MNESYFLAIVSSAGKLYLPMTLILLINEEHMISATQITIRQRRNLFYKIDCGHVFMIMIRMFQEVLYST